MAYLAHRPGAAIREANIMRKSLARRMALIVLLPAALFGTVVVASPAQAAPTTTQMQSAIGAATNVARGKAGCASVRLDANLARAARNHSAWMAQTVTFSHVGSGGSSFVTRAPAGGHAPPHGEHIPR